MSFPNNPSVGQRITLASNKTYEFTGYGWKRVTDAMIMATTETAGAVELATELEALQGFDDVRAIVPSVLKSVLNKRFVIADTMPVDPVENQYWYNPDDNRLSIWVTNEGWRTVASSRVVSSTAEPANPENGLIWYNPNGPTLRVRISDMWIAIPVGIGSGASPLDRAVPLTWVYGDAAFDFELFVPHADFNWRGMEPVPVLQTLNGDDTVVVENTANLKSGDSYVVYDNASGTRLTELTILSILSPTQFRTAEPLSVTLTQENGAMIGKTSYLINADGYATVNDGDVLYSKPLYALRNRSEGRLFIRRSASGEGSFTVQYRVAGTTDWTTARLLRTTMALGDPNSRDQEYDLKFGGALEFQITYNVATPGATETVQHFALLQNSQSIENNRIAQPENVTPANEAVNITQTPTLTGSAYRSLYNIAQNGAHFQVAEDQAMANIVVNSSSDFLASWIATAGETANWTGVLGVGAREAIAVGGAVVKRTTDGGVTWTAGAFSGTPAMNAIAWNGSRAFSVGDAGAIQYSDNKGVSWTTAPVAASYTGSFKGVAATSTYAIAVGASGMIQRSSNNGGIWAVVAPANSYTGQFNAVCIDSTGKAIAVGANGEIQTSPDMGANWVRRTAANAYSGTFYGVAMNEQGFAVAVGANGMIQTSTDFGATWTVRAADGVTTALNAVAIAGDYAIAVGDSGAILTSYNKGVTWVKRLPAGGITGTFKTVDFGTDNDYAFLLGSSGLVQRPLKLEGAGVSYTVPAGSDLLQPNKVYWWRCRYMDAAGFWSEWSAPTSFATMASFNYVQQPFNLSPADLATNVSVQPLLQGSEFTFAGAQDTHAKSQWQIATVSNFGSMHYDSGESNDLLKHEVPSGYLLANNVKYWWRVRYKGTNNGFGPWSIPTSFTSRAQPNRPVITSPSNNAINVSLKPTITTSAFLIAGSSAAHTASQYQVSRDTGFTDLIYDSQATPDLVSHVINGSLTSNSSFYIRARHRAGDLDWSPWSETVKINTVSVGVAAPTVSVGSVTVSAATISATAFVLTGSGGTDTHLNTDWEIRTANNGGGTVVWSSAADTSNKTLINATGLPAGTTLYARARYRGGVYGTSEWSNSYQFQTQAAGISTPSVSIAAVGSTSVSLTSSSFATTGAGATDTHESTDWEIRTAANGGGTLVWESLGNTTSKLSITATGINPGATLYARVRHTGVNLGKSGWSASVQVTTDAVTVAKPTIAVVGKTTDSVSLTSSAFSILGTGVSDTHLNTDWEVRNAANGGGTVVAAVNADAAGLTSKTLGGLSPNQTYYARVRHRSNNYGVSAWSDSVAFSTNQASGEAAWGTAGTYSLTIPAGVTSVSAVTIGAGAATDGTNGGGGGALAYRNDIPVTPGETLTAYVGTPGGPSVSNSYLARGGTVLVLAGGGNGITGGSRGGYAGGNGGNGGTHNSGKGGGGGAAGRYTGDGGSGATHRAVSSQYWVPPVTTYGAKYWKVRSTGKPGNVFAQQTQTTRDSTFPQMLNQYSPQFPANGMPSASGYAVNATIYTYSQFTQGPYTYQAGGEQEGPFWDHTKTILAYDCKQDSTTKPGYWATTTTIEEVPPTGVAGQGRGGLGAGSFGPGEGVGLNGSNAGVAGGWGQGAGVWGGQTQGAVRVIWGPGRSFPNSAT